MKKITLMLTLCLLLILFTGCPFESGDEGEGDSDDVEEFELGENETSDVVHEGWVVVVDSGSSADTGDTGDTGNAGDVGGGSEFDPSDLGDIDWSEVDPDELEASLEEYREDMLDDDADSDEFKPEDKPKMKDEEPDQEEEPDEEEIIWEGYLWGSIDGNPSFEHDVYLSSIAGHMEGPIYVYSDFSVSGQVDVTYGDMGPCVTAEPGSSCSLLYTTDGTYKVTGSVVQYQEVTWGEKSEEWPFPDDYWLQIFFTRITPATETLLFVAPYYSAEVTDNGMESILYGPFMFPHMFYPGLVSESVTGEVDVKNFNVSNHWATGSIFLELFDAKGGEARRMLEELLSS